MIHLHSENCKECHKGVMEAIGYTDHQGILHFQPFKYADMDGSSSAQFLVHVCSRCGNTKFVTTERVIEMFERNRRLMLQGNPSLDVLY